MLSVAKPFLYLSIHPSLIKWMWLGTMLADIHLKKHPFLRVPDWRSSLVNRPHPAFCRRSYEGSSWEGIWLLHGDLGLNMAINFLTVNLQHSLAFSMTWKPQACGMPSKGAIVKSHMTRFMIQLWVTWPSCKSHEPVVRVIWPSCESHDPVVSHMSQL